MTEGFPYFKQSFYSGRIVRHRGERKVIKTASINNYGKVLIQFIDNTTCDNIKDIELDGRK